MRTPATLLAFVVGLAVLFGLAVSLGESFGSLFGIGSPAIPGDRDEPRPGGDSQPPDRAEPGGLAIADQGYVLWPAATRFSAGEYAEFFFTIFTVDRVPVTNFVASPDQRMELVVVRRDLTEYQRLHPSMAADGTWTARLRLDEPGSYRAFATFRPGAAPAPVTLGVDLEVPGLVEPRAIPHPSPLAEIDEYTVMLEGDVIAGGVSRLYLNVLRDSDPVTDLEPHRGALGHLVMLREGDLAYLEVRPVAGTGKGQKISFEVAVPTPGFYRVFVEFQHGGEVRVAEFTVMAS